MQNGNKNSRLAFLADRMAILMAICIVQTGGKLNPWFRESLYTGETGDELRELHEYRIAKQIVRNMLKREMASQASSDSQVGKPIEGPPAG